MSRDQAAIDRCDSACRSADDRLVGLESALDDLDQRIADTTEKISLEKDQIEREAASKDLVALCAAAAQALDAFRVAAQCVVEAVEPLPALPCSCARDRRGRWRDI
jgi:predicted  nucleic acid-binding Zn-ribbon protein